MGWVIKDSQDEMYRTMEQGDLKWTENYRKALHFSRREDAERFCAEDNGTNFIQFVPYDITDNAGFFNQLSPAEAERLWLLVEEMGETLQAIGKIGRHGYESCHPGAVVGQSNNRGDLQKELGHVLHGMQRLSGAGDISWNRVLDENGKKKDSVKPYLHHQEAE